MTDPEASAVLRRAARRAAFHLLRAGLEGVKAVEAVVDEFARVNRDEGSGEDDDGPERERIDIE